MKPDKHSIHAEIILCRLKIFLLNTHHDKKKVLSYEEQMEFEKILCQHPDAHSLSAEDARNIYELIPSSGQKAVLYKLCIKCILLSIHPECLLLLMELMILPGT